MNRTDAHLCPAVQIGVKLPRQDGVERVKWFGLSLLAAAAQHQADIWRAAGVAYPAYRIKWKFVPLVPVVREVYPGSSLACQPFVRLQVFEAYVAFLAADSRRENSMINLLGEGRMIFCGAAEDGVGEVWT